MTWDAALAYAKNDFATGEFKVKSLKEFILQLKKVYDIVENAYNSNPNIEDEAYEDEQEDET